MASNAIWIPFYFFFPPFESSRRIYNTIRPLSLSSILDNQSPNSHLIIISPSRISKQCFHALVMATTSNEYSTKTVINRSNDESLKGSKLKYSSWPDVLQNMIIEKPFVSNVSQTYLYTKVNALFVFMHCRDDKNWFIWFFARVRKVQKNVFCMRPKIRPTLNFLLFESKNTFIATYSLFDLRPANLSGPKPTLWYFRNKWFCLFCFVLSPFSWFFIYRIIHEFMYSLLHVSTCVYMCKQVNFSF